jgi:phage FluMu protein Com
MKAEHEHNIRCDHCEKKSDIISLPARNLRYAKLPNTLTDLNDINNVEWLCPHCECWNDEESKPK